MATGLPSQTQVIELLDAEFTRAGYEIEDVVIDERSQPPQRELELAGVDRGVQTEGGA